MSFPFDPHQGLVVVRTEIFGPRGSAIVRLALDTGATKSLINTGLLFAIGYDAALVPDRVEITTGSGIEYFPQVALTKLIALGQERLDFQILCHTLPPSAGIDGLLGLDFFRGHKLVLDFQTGRISLET